MKKSNRIKQIYLIKICVALTLVLQSCTEETGSLGILPDAEEITSTHSMFTVYTRSLAMDSVLANSTNCFLGSIVDPETGSRVTANFAAQFHTFENFTFPTRQRMFPLDTLLEVQPSHANEPIYCDSVDVRLYFDEYYGDGHNPMKLEIFELDKEHLLSEDSTYYSNVNLEQFVVKNAQPIATKMFTPIDYSISTAERESSTHVDNICISLPSEFGTYLMNTYYEHPEYYKDSYSFIRKVFPGFYFRLKNGNGTMVGFTVGTLNLHFKFFDEVYADSVYQGLARFASTPEVIQSTSFENDDVSELVNDQSCTYLKTPSGICTEATLPIKEIYSTHKSDSVNKAQLTLTRYNKTQGNKNQLGIPGELLMVRKQEMYTFFENHKIADNQTSYVASFDETYNTYTYTNLSRLISFCQNEKLKGMEDEGLTESQWEAKHPDWNKVALIPVKCSYVTSTSSSGSTYKSTSSVKHDLDMNSVRLVGGPNSPIDMQVIYSHFQ